MAAIHKMAAAVGNPQLCGALSDVTIVIHIALASNPSISPLRVIGKAYTCIKSCPAEAIL